MSASLSEEEQLDSLKSFTKKYGSSIVSGILIALIAFFAWQYWQKKTTAESQMLTAQTQQIMDSARMAQSDPNIFNELSATADKILKDHPDTAQAIQVQLLMAKLAFDKADYASAEKALKRVENAKIKDEGLLQIVKLRLGYSQLAQKKYDDAIKTFSSVTSPAFKGTADEALGDVYVAKNDIENAKKAYKSAWDALLERKQERQILQIKLESVGVLVDDPNFERPILETNVDES